MKLLEKNKSLRRYVDKSLLIKGWLDIASYFLELENRTIDTLETVQQWLHDRSELESIIEEDAAWRYIKMNCDTSDKALLDAYNDYVTNIEPEVHKELNKLDKKLAKSGWLDQLDSNRYFTFTRAIKKQLEIFREENLPLFTEMQKKEQKYGAISSQMLINYNEKELTLQQAAKYLKDTNKDIRREVYHKISNCRLQEVARFNKLFDELLEIRNKIALNAGFKNYRDYRFAELGRFDYTHEDCEEFQKSIYTEVCPLVDELYVQRKASLEYNTLKPWDLEVDVHHLPPLKPYDDSEELIEKTIQCFGEIRKSYGDYIRIMHDNGYLDLDSRKGKAPGGFNYPLYESNVPFIFMNSVGSQRDLETMVHEGGHAIHAFLSKDMELVHFKNVPAEVAELASMSMELISMEHWHFFYPERDDYLRARRYQLEGIIKVLPWIASIDKFQQWIYTHPNHHSIDRKEAWTRIFNEFSSQHIDWTGQEEDFKNTWQKQIHIFQYPFYYIEYGIAQLGAIAIWKNYRENKEKALDRFDAALSLGYSRPISDIYDTAGIEFNFSRDYIHELMLFLSKELMEL